jgi:hypothetical protein
MRKTKRLALNKERLRNLTPQHLVRVAGGWAVRNVNQVTNTDTGSYESCETDDWIVCTLTITTVNLTTRLGSNDVCIV